MKKVVFTTKMLDNLADFMGDLIIDMDYDADDDILVICLDGQCYTEAFESNRKKLENLLGPITRMEKTDHFGEDYTNFTWVMKGKKITISVE